MGSPHPSNPELYVPAQCVLVIGVHFQNVLLCGTVNVYLFPVTNCSLGGGVKRMGKDVL